MRKTLGLIRYYKLYRPALAKRVLADRNGIPDYNLSTDDSLARTFEWIKASFDATPDGGSSAYYRVGHGWKGSYPETTGYLIPTMYDYAADRNSSEWRQLARGAADWLLSIQAPEGGWQGLQIGVDCELRVFNTAMVLDGLAAAYRVEGDEKYLKAAKRGLDWCLSKLDDSGFFSENNVVGGGAFDLLVCACLLMVIQLLPQAEQESYNKQVRTALDAHLGLQTANGWFANCNFSDADKCALLHHIGYSIEGLAISGEILNDKKYLLAAEKTATQLVEKLEQEGRIPAFIDPDWNTVLDLGKDATICLTGCSQVAIVFQRLYARNGNESFQKAALKINKQVAAIAGRASSEAGLNYGVAGSFPIGGNYQGFQIVNWAAKYHAESLLMSKNACLPKHVRTAEHA